MSKKKLIIVLKTPKGRGKLSTNQIKVVRHEGNHNNLNATKVEQKLELPMTIQHIPHALQSTAYVK